MASKWVVFAKEEVGSFDTEEEADKYMAYCDSWDTIREFEVMEVVENGVL